MHISPAFLWLECNVFAAAARAMLGQVVIHRPGQKGQSRHATSLVPIIAATPSESTQAQQEKNSFKPDPASNLLGLPACSYREGVNALYVNDSHVHVTVHLLMMHPVPTLAEEAVGVLQTVGPPQVGVGQASNS